MQLRNANVVQRAAFSAGVVLEQLKKLHAEGRLDEAVEQSGPLAQLVRKLAAAGFMVKVDGHWRPNFDEPASAAPQAFEKLQGRVRAFVDAAPENLRPSLERFLTG